MSFEEKAEAVRLLLQTLSARSSALVGNATNSYKNFVSQNPETIAQVEKTLKTSSYLYEAFSKNYNNSIFIAEIVSAANNLFSYANACLLLKEKRTKEQNGRISHKIRHLLSVIEFSQTFIEISVQRIWNEKAKWLVIGAISIIKVILRCILLFYYDSGIQSPAVGTLLSHSALMTKVKNEQTNNSDDSLYVGKHSGIVMRTLSNMTSQRRWADTEDTWLHNSSCLPSTKLSGAEKFGELLHISRPLIHLLSMASTGKSSIFPWITSLITDASSHVLLQRDNNGKKKFNHFEQIELRRRYVGLVLYLLRSPIYDQYTGPHLFSVFNYLSENIPLVRYVLEPLSGYLPAWQDVYFYNWAN